MFDSRILTIIFLERVIHFVNKQLINSMLSSLLNKPLLPLFNKPMVIVKIRYLTISLKVKSEFYYVEQNIRVFILSTIILYLLNNTNINCEVSDNSQLDTINSVY